MREVTPAQRARLGIFLLVSGAVLLGLILAVTGTKFLEKWDRYTIHYRDVSVGGLEVGAQVKYHGVRVGRVDDISIDPHQVESVIVTMSVKHGTPIKADVQAVITGSALTGIKFIELTGGSTHSETLKPGSEIPAGASDFELITGRAEAVTEKLELVLGNLAVLTSAENRERILRLIDHTGDVMEDLDGVILEAQPHLTRTAHNLDEASNAIVELAKSRQLRDVIARLDTTVAEVQAAQLGKAIADLQVALKQAQVTLTHVDLTLLKGRHDILTSLEVLRESLDSFNEFTRLIAEDPSLLLRGRRGDEGAGPVR